MERPNYTAVPNRFVDEWMPKIKKEATLCFLAICRKTIGWHKDCDALSYSQLQKMTGMRLEAIKISLDYLEKAGLIVVTRDPGKTNVIDLNLEPLRQVEGSPPTGGEVTPPTGGETKETLKETLQKKRPERRVVTIDMSTGKFGGLTDRDYQQWREAFPAVDVKVEERSAGLWCMDNPTKTKRDYHRFLTNWFRRCQERGGTKGYRPPIALSPVRPPSKQEPPLSDADRAANLGMLQNLQRDLANKKKLA